MTFDPSKEYAAIAFDYFAHQKGLPITPQDDMKAATLEQALIQWTKVAEKSIDWAIRMQHIEDPEKFPTKNLPKQAKGRAKTTKIIQKPFTNHLRELTSSIHFAKKSRSTLHLFTILQIVVVAMTAGGYIFDGSQASAKRRS